MRCTKMSTKHQVTISCKKHEDQHRAQSAKKEQREKLHARLTSVRKRIDQAYMDKLDGTISAEFWQRMTAEWQMEEQQILLALQGLEQASPDTFLNAKKTLELANRAYFLYVSQKPAEQAKLLKIVLSNCKTDGVSLFPLYRRPFDLIFEKAKTKEWRRGRDSNPRYPFGYSGFQDRLFQPLTHPSARARWCGQPSSSLPQSRMVSGFLTF